MKMIAKNMDRSCFSIKLNGNLKDMEAFYALLPLEITIEGKWAIWIFIWCSYFLSELEQYMQKRNSSDYLTLNIYISWKEFPNPIWEFLSTVLIEAHCQISQFMFYKTQVINYHKQDFVHITIQLDMYVARTWLFFQHYMDPIFIRQSSLHLLYFLEIFCKCP